jgi:hypothetical protein
LCRWWIRQQWHLGGGRSVRRSGQEFAALEFKGSVKPGIGKVDLTSGFEMDDCFKVRPKGKVEACVGPVCEKLFDPTATPKDKFSIDEKTRQIKNPFEATKGGFDKPKLKLSLRICQQLQF